jgi:hypothetical protein
MMAPKIERVDTIPLIIGFLEKMGVQPVIECIFTPHGNWSGLSYGQLTVLFVTYVLHSLTHRFSGMESWVNQHKAVIERVTGWRVGEKDATDDRLGRLAQVLGETTKAYRNANFGWDKASSVRINCRHRSFAMTPRASMCTTTRTTAKTASWNLATAKIIGRICCNSNRVWQHWTRPEFRF